MGKESSNRGLASRAHPRPPGLYVSYCSLGVLLLASSNSMRTYKYETIVRTFVPALNNSFSRQMKY